MIPSENDNTVIIAKGAVVALIGKVGGRALQFGLQIFLARILGPIQFGLYALGLTFLQIGQQIGLLGLDNGIIHFGGSSLQNDKKNLITILWTSQFLSFICAMIVAVLMYFIAPWLSIFFFHDAGLSNVMQGFSVAVVFSSLLRVASAGTRLSHKTHFSVISEDVMPVVANLGLMLVFSYVSKARATDAVLAFVTGVGIGWILAAFFLNRLFSLSTLTINFSLSLAKDLLLYSLPIFFGVMFVFLLYGITIFFVGYFLAPQEVGIYQASSQISTISLVVLMAFNSIFVPMIPNLYKETQMSELNGLFVISTKWGLYVSLPLLVVIVLMPHELLEILYGKEYINGAWPLVILTIAQTINAGTGAVGFLLNMTNNQNRWLLLSFYSFLIGLVLNIWLIPKWGIVGAAVSNACSVVVLYTLALLSVKSILKLWPYDKRYWKGILATVVCVVVILLFLQFSPSQSLFHLLIAITLSFLSFIFSLWLFGFDPEDMQVANIVFRRLLSVSLEKGN